MTTMGQLRQRLEPCLYKARKIADYRNFQNKEEARKNPSLPVPEGV
jgi:hypothetical protein